MAEKWPQQFSEGFNVRVKAGSKRLCFVQITLTAIVQQDASFKAGFSSRHASELPPKVKADMVKLIRYSGTGFVIPPGGHDRQRKMKRLLHEMLKESRCFSYEIA